ncbi:PilZ domain-containing protein [Thalassotalea sp. G2M2-11]|uniref:PilZ domain-containing protein n=1 Tax=Thalassotalea sp. G2M2-11 TaxID=2787627 RepID=UPI0019D29242|nr:PilZ domain-containing protein [Thalassotalea sp. G2M2-11]
MSVTDNQEKLKQFDEFFTIKHQFNINVKVINTSEITDYQHFLAAIPAPFKLVNDMTSIDQAALKPLQAVSGVAGQLVDYLHHQAQKIDLLLGYILSQQDEQALRFQGQQFGGAGIIFHADSAFKLNDFVELKVFLPTENAAIYSYAEIIDVEKIQEKYQHKLLFHFIRDEDRELLVRASLHIQSKQLQQLAKERQAKASN